MVTPCLHVSPGTTDLDAVMLGLEPKAPRILASILQPEPPLCMAKICPYKWQIQITRSLQRRSYRYTGGVRVWGVSVWVCGFSISLLCEVGQSH